MDDLFALFPDLPGLSLQRPLDERVRAVQIKAELARRRMTRAVAERRDGTAAAQRAFRADRIRRRSRS